LAGEYPAYPLIEAAIKSSRLPRVWTIVVVAASLLLLLILIAYLDGILATLLEWSLLRYIVFDVILIAYFLAVYPFMMRLREKAAFAFKPLLPLDDDAFNQLATDISKPSRRWEWTAIFLGAAFFLSAISQPWSWDWVPGYFGVTVYFVIVSTILYGLVSWLIYDTLIGIVRVNRLSRQDLKLDILDTEMLVPVARWSLGISLVFVGAISLTIIENWEIMLIRNSIIGNAIAVCVTVVIFFFSMWSAHRAMNEAKKRKLKLARKHLADVYRELEDQAAKGQLKGAEKLSSTINMWVTYEKRAKEASTWPFNPVIVSRLAISVLTPAAVYIIKIIGQYWARFGF
jgi:hypothetical protein